MGLCKFPCDLRLGPRPESGTESRPQAESRYVFTFTFTLNCHPGKTHSNRSRGDTTWEARSVTCSIHV